MAANYLEQLIAEWYEYQGVFVRRNVLVGKLPRGGHECELDVVAFHAQEQRLFTLNRRWTWAVAQSVRDDTWRILGLGETSRRPIVQLGIARLSRLAW